MQESAHRDLWPNQHLQRRRWQAFDGPASAASPALELSQNAGFFGPRFRGKRPANLCHFGGVGEKWPTHLRRRYRRRRLGPGTCSLLQTVHGLSASLRSSRFGVILICCFVDLVGCRARTTASRLFGSRHSPLRSRSRSGSPTQRSSLRPNNYLDLMQHTERTNASYISSFSFTFELTPRSLKLASVAGCLSADCCCSLLRGWVVCLLPSRSSSPQCRCHLWKRYSALIGTERYEMLL